MSIYAYYIENEATPKNEKRGGTLRVGSSTPNPIEIIKGYDTTLLFAFRDSQQRVYDIQGRTVTATITDVNGIEKWNGNFRLHQTSGVGVLNMIALQLAAIEPGLYSLSISETTGGSVTRMRTGHNMQRYVLKVLAG